MATTRHTSRDVTFAMSPKGGNTIGIHITPTPDIQSQRLEMNVTIINPLSIFGSEICCFLCVQFDINVYMILIMDWSEIDAVKFNIFTAGSYIPSKTIVFPTMSIWRLVIMIHCSG